LLSGSEHITFDDDASQAVHVRKEVEQWIGHLSVVVTIDDIAMIR